MSVICHLSSLTSADNVKCQMSAMTDDGNNLHQYGCLQKRLCKCSNLVEIRNWLDHYVRNESQYGPHAYFPLYIFGISFIKWKRMAPENESLKTLDFFWFHLFRYKGSLIQKMGQKKTFLIFLGNPSVQAVKYVSVSIQVSQISAKLSRVWQNQTDWPHLP